MISTFEDGLVTLSRDSYELLVSLLGASKLMFALKLKVELRSGCRAS